MKQLFTHEIKYKDIVDLLKNITIQEHNYYILTFDKYKQLKYSKKIHKMHNDLITLYKPSKQFYVKNMNTYKGFLTVIRQLCKSVDIHYKIEIQYDRSSYTIYYKFVLD